MADIAPISPGARLIHIGPQKTGTTAVQWALTGVRKELPGWGAYYPRGSHRRRVAGFAIGVGGESRASRTPIREWNKLVREIERAGELRACVSDEHYSRATPEQARRIITELGSAETHVIAVARPLQRLLPSQWQERVKWGQMLGFEDWLRLLLEADRTNISHSEVWSFWAGHDIQTLVRRWIEFVEPSRFHLVIADESDRRQLFDIFEGLLGLPPATLQPMPGRTNTSLSWAETELLRRIGQAYKDAQGGAEAARELRKTLVKELRAANVPTAGPKAPSLPAWALAPLRDICAEQADEIASLAKSSGLNVIGDPQSLLLNESELPQATSTDPTREDELVLPVDAAVSVARAVLRVAGAYDPITEAPVAQPEAADLRIRELAGLAASRLLRRSR